MNEKIKISITFSLNYFDLSVCFGKCLDAASFSRKNACFNNSMKVTTLFFAKN